MITFLQQLFNEWIGWRIDNSNLLFTLITGINCPNSNKVKAHQLQLRAPNRDSYLNPHKLIQKRKKLFES